MAKSTTPPDRPFQFGIGTVLLWVVPYVALLAWIASWQYEPLPEESMGDAIGGVVALVLAELYAAAALTATWISLIAIAVWLRRRSTA